MEVSTKSAARMSTLLMPIRGVITPLFSGVGIGVAFTSNKLELELLELDPQLESTPSLELAPQEEQEE